MNKLLLALGIFLSSCSHVTTLRTAELQKVESNLKIRIDSLQMIVDSLSVEQQSQNRRIQADLRLLLTTLAESNEKLEARLEEQQYLLDRISQEKNAKPKIRLSPALSGGVQTAPEVQPEATKIDSIPSELSPVDSLSSSTGEADKLYNQAKVDFNGDRFKEAFLGFKTVYEMDPIGNLAESSLFWMANAYGKTAQGPKAIQVLERLIVEFPQGTKLCAAHYQIGKIQGEMGEKEAQTQSWKKLIAEKQCAGTNEVFRVQEELSTQN